VRVAIVGLGLMGGSLALALRGARPDVELVGHDTDQATIRKAVREGIVAEGDPGTADVVVLAAPIPALPELLAGLSGTKAVVTDMASTKAMVMGWALAAGVDLVGGHPMCGREQSGLQAADPAIFRGAPWVLTRDEPVVTDLVRAVGAKPVVLDAELHDRLVAGVSHAAFALSTAYVLALAASGDWDRMAELAGSGFRDMSRLAAGDPLLYAAVTATNRRHMIDSLRAVEASLARLRRHLEAEDPRLVELFEEAKRLRDAWSSSTSHVPGTDGPPASAHAGS
jgi:prephenate dehydrogenase